MVAQNTKKHQRTCIGCGQQSNKSLLYRVVCSSSGVVAFDPTGRMPGRGAYVCSMQCFDDARTKNKFDHALRTRLTEEDYEAIKRELASVCGSKVDKVEE